jgi:hypothetical protein
MMFCTERRSRGSDYVGLPPHALPQRVLGGVALAFVATLSAWTVCSFADTGTDQTDFAARWGDRFGAAVTFADRFADSRGDSLGVTATFGDRFAGANATRDKLALAKPRPPSSNVYASLFDARFSVDRPSDLANDTPQRSDGDLIAPKPLSLSAANPGARGIPLPRDRATKSSTASRSTSSAALRDGGPGKQADSSANKPTIFQRIVEKLFGKPAPVKMAYAATDDAGLGVGQSIAAGRYDRSTAVYDISARTVYMPDGSRLEAHSGLGDRLDDPSHPDEKARGVTPPNIYDLQLRESPFHGVRALRLIPQDEEKVFGRRGLLVHRYMLGPNGDSNGCVSIKNYDAFLQAYLNHDIKRLAVVTRLE